MKKSVVDDAFSSYLIEKAFFEGKIEMPCIAKPESIIIPEALIPFSQRRSTTTYSEFVHFYEYDEKFASVMSSTNKFLDELRRFKGVISPDCSLYTFTLFPIFGGAMNAVIHPNVKNLPF